MTPKKRKKSEYTKQIFARCVGYKKGYEYLSDLRSLPDERRGCLALKTKN